VAGRLQVIRRAVALLLGPALVAAGPVGAQPARSAADFPRPGIPWHPRRYVCYRTEDAPRLDGRLDDPGWEAAPWTEDFVDITGDAARSPRLRTRVKLLWDEDHLYVAALLEEPDLWATLTLRDAVVYHDHDFEIFLDPDGDHHQYAELEINALNTVWDLFLVRPYRDGGPALHGWDIAGLRSAVALEGTLNQPWDTDSGWSLEIAIPWAALAACARGAVPPGGDHRLWHLNFSRVEWRLEERDGGYVKLRNRETGEPLPEDNWVWSPQGLVAMHYPEMWGLVWFSPATAAGAGPAPAWPAPAELAARSQLMQVYYRQKQQAAAHGTFAREAKDLDLGGLDLGPGFRLQTTPSFWEATLPGPGFTAHVDHAGRFWTTRP